MRGSSRFLLVLLTGSLAACQSQTQSQAGAPALKSVDQKASYAIGYQTGGQIAPTEAHLDLDAFMAGVRDGMANNDLALPEEDLQEAVDSFYVIVNEERHERWVAEEARNIAEAKAFFEKNGAREGVTTTESGLQYEVLRRGDGPTPGPDDRVEVNYKGTLLDGTVFDSSYDRDEPSTFRAGGLIAGFSEGLQLMPVGSEYRLYIPADLAYGAKGRPPEIGPNAALIFDVELLRIVN